MRVADTGALDRANASLGDSRASKLRSFTSEDNWMRCVGSYSKFAPIQECTLTIMVLLNSIAINCNQSVEKALIRRLVPRHLTTMRAIMA